MAIQLDEATLIALIIESLFFGIFTVLFSISLYILILRKRHTEKVNRALVSVSVLMYIVAFVHICASARRACIAFLQENEQAGEANDWLISTSDPLYLLQVGLYVVQTLIGDSFMAFRLYVVWEKDKRLLFVTMVLLVASLACAIVAETNAALVGTNMSIFVPRLKHWILSFFCLTLFTNLSCTALIAYKIWNVKRKLRNSISWKDQSPVIPIIIESSVVYSLALVCLTGLFGTGSWAQYILLDLLVPLIGVTFTLIIVRIGLGLSHGNTLSHSNDLFSQRGNDGAFRNRQTLHMHPLVVQIEQSRITVDDAHELKVQSPSTHSD